MEDQFRNTLITRRFQNRSCVCGIRQALGISDSELLKSHFLCAVCGPYCTLFVSRRI